jgi:hypothetical protein
MQPTYLPERIVRMYLLVRDEYAARPPVHEACCPANDGVAFCWLPQPQHTNTDEENNDAV